jgi:hypothetical protein
MEHIPGIPVAGLPVDMNSAPFVWHDPCPFLFLAEHMRLPYFHSGGQGSVFAPVTMDAMVFFVA